MNSRETNVYQCSNGDEQSTMRMALLHLQCHRSRLADLESHEVSEVTFYYYRPKPLSTAESNDTTRLPDEHINSAAQDTALTSNTTSSTLQEAFILHGIRADSRRLEMGNTTVQLTRRRFPGAKSLRNTSNGIHCELRSSWSKTNTT